MLQNTGYLLPPRSRYSHKLKETTVYADLQTLLYFNYDKLYTTGAHDQYYTGYTYRT